MIMQLEGGNIRTLLRCVHLLSVPISTSLCSCLPSASAWSPLADGAICAAAEAAILLAATPSHSCGRSSARARVAVSLSLLACAVVVCVTPRRLSSIPEEQRWVRGTRWQRPQQQRSPPSAPCVCVVSTRLCC